MKRTLLRVLLTPMFFVGVAPLFAQSQPILTSAAPDLVIKPKAPDPVVKPWIGTSRFDLQSPRDHEFKLGKVLEGKFFKPPGFLGVVTRKKWFQRASDLCCDIESNAPDPPQFGPQTSRHAVKRRRK